MSEATLHIDIVSDVVCPWCVVGYKRLEAALNELQLGDKVELEWQPFFLNPDVEQGGRNLREHLAKKYGGTEEQSQAIRERLTQLGADYGFTFDFFPEMNTYSTFTAHQLLHWAKQYQMQTELKLAFFTAYFTERKVVDDTEVLLGVVEKLDMDVAEAREILTSGEYIEQIKADAAIWVNSGVHAVPAFIFNRQYLLSGAQEVAVFKEQIQHAFKEVA